MLELESLLLFICNLQELCVLAILYEPLAHARLVLTPMDAKDCQDIVKNPLGFFTTEGPLAMVLFLEILNNQVFPDSGPKNLRFCHVHTQMVLLPYPFFFLKLFVSTVGDNKLGIFS